MTPEQYDKLASGRAPAEEIGRLRAINAELLAVLKECQDALHNRHVVTDSYAGHCAKIAADVISRVGS